MWGGGGVVSGCGGEASGVSRVVSSHLVIPRRPQLSRIDSCAGHRHDLTDAQWEVLAPFLPEAPVGGRPRRYCLRGLVDGVRYRARTGCPWRDVPDRYGPWWRIHALFCSWQVCGVWEHLERELTASVVTTQGPEVVWDEVSVDSTTCRARVLSAGQAADCPMIVPVLEAIRVAHRELADKAYSSQANRVWLRAHRIRATIAVTADQTAHRRARGMPTGLRRRDVQKP